MQRRRLQWGERTPSELAHLLDTVIGVVQYGLCGCPSCEADGKHHDDCTVHHADYEDVDPPPCDCGLRDGRYREPANAITTVCCFATTTRPE